MRILKYNITESRTHNLPKGTRILTAQEQHGSIMVWALVEELEDFNLEEGDDSVLEMEDYNFSIVPTGMDITNDLKQFQYINTVQQAGGALIWHIFVDKLYDL